MCGIVGYTGSDQATGILLEGLQKLEYRGYDSAGIAVLNNGIILNKKTAGQISALSDKIGCCKSIPGTVGIGHTRWATHGAPTDLNAHPHMSADRQFAVVHNGIIENYAELRDELEADGIRFISQTDTEVIPQLIAKYYKGDFLDAVRKAVARLRGSYALGIICKDNPNTMIAVRNFSPLIIGLGYKMKLLASDITALIGHTKKMIYLSDGDIAVLKPDNLEIYNECNLVYRDTTEITWDISAAEKDGYEHFMMKEIMEQPRAVGEAIERRIRNNKINFGDLRLDKAKLNEISYIHIVACGSAYHAGMVGKYVIEKLARIPVQIDLASEYRYRDPICSENTLVVVISQSGETADTLAALLEAKKKGAYVLSVVNVVGSSIAKAADDVIYTYAGPEIAVATTKGYSTQVAVLYLLAVWIGEQLGELTEKEAANFIKEILALPKKIALVLEQNKEGLKELALMCCKEQSLFFIGRNIDYAVSLEASLKLKEISYIHSESYAAGELKHGTISLIEDGRIVLALCCYDELSEKIMSNIKEVKARGAYVVATTCEKSSCIENEADKIIRLPDIHPLLSASIEVLPYQLLAYYVTCELGYDVDKPRNLAKSVTVE